GKGRGGADGGCRHSCAADRRLCVCRRARVAADPAPAAAAAGGVFPPGVALLKIIAQSIERRHNSTDAPGGPVRVPPALAPRRGQVTRRGAPAARSRLRPHCAVVTCPPRLRPPPKTKGVLKNGGWGGVRNGGTSAVRRGGRAPE